MRLLKRMLWTLLFGVTVLVLALYLRHGGGATYADLSTQPLWPESTLETVVTFDQPIGNHAVAADGRVFFTVHPESRPEGAQLWVSEAGKSRPFPSAELQKTLFASALGLRIDRQQRLWVIDPAHHGTSGAKLVAFDLASGKVVRNIALDSVAPIGSFLQDFAVSPDGSHIYIADVSFWRQSPALIVVDVDIGHMYRVLQKHSSVTAQNWLVRNQIKAMSFFGGLVNLKPGVDGITLSRDGQWLYYAAMTHDGLFRIATAALNDTRLDAAALAARVERVSSKPLNDGLTSDDQGRIYITDVEHQGVMRWSPGEGLRTLIRSSKIRWADSVAFGPDGYLYIADSAIPDQMLRSKAHIRSVAPYFIFRVRTDATAESGS